MSLWCQKLRLMGSICHPGDIYFPCSHNQVFKIVSIARHKNNELIDGGMDRS